MQDCALNTAWRERKLKTFSRKESSIDSSFVLPVTTIHDVSQMFTKSTRKEWVTLSDRVAIHSRINVKTCLPFIVVDIIRINTIEKNIAFLNAKVTPKSVECELPTQLV